MEIHYQRYGVVTAVPDDERKPSSSFVAQVAWQGKHQSLSNLTIQL